MGKNFVVALIILLLAAQPAPACTSFALPQSPERIVAKSYDWHQGHGALIVNQRGLQKTALRLRPTDVPAKWISRFASFTFNQHGRELPLGGMNEKGLVVEILWLDTSVYPKDSRPMVNELQWIQYQLDSYSTVRQMIANAHRIRVANEYAKVHYLACDARASCATFEYLNGRLFISFGRPLRVPVLANNPYQESVKHLSRFKDFGGTSVVPTDGSSLSRFARAASRVKKYNPRGKVSAVDEAFDILKSVGGTDKSKFHIVYEPKSRTLHFKTFTHPTLKQLRFSDYEDHYGSSIWNCEKGKDKTRLFDLNQDLEGDITGSLVAYTKEQNQAMIDLGLEGIKEHLPAGAVESLAAYPEKQLCRR